MSTGQPQEFRKTTSIAKRMPNVWTDRHRGMRSAQPTGGTRRRASPHNLRHHDSATTTRTQS
jgi:hypothetical protein